MSRMSAAERERVGKTIKALREAYGWKLGQFATTVGISYSYLSNLEAGRKQAGPDIYRRIAEVLTVPLAAILSADFLMDIPPRGAGLEKSA